MSERGLGRTSTIFGNRFTITGEPQNIKSSFENATFMLRKLRENCEERERLVVTSI